jgi:23S rRNA (cytidine1920-2'-O)/16S rRNA (cytidine1409-2'-O)-methyltransferase
MDVGSSTGGFTDVLLTKGAAKVYAVDSGTNQLAWKLRQDPRVIVHEQTSARILTAAHIPEPVNLIVCDASFIGLAKVLERPLTFASGDARLLALIKPQFEVGRDSVGKGGVVRDPALHASACADVASWIIAQGWDVEGIVPSPITGPEGNVEFLIAANRNCCG